MAPESTVVTHDETECGVTFVGAVGLRAAEKVPLEVLERNLTSHAAHLAAVEAQWLGWLGEHAHSAAEPMARRPRSSRCGSRTMTPISQTQRSGPRWIR